MTKSIFQGLSYLAHPLLLPLYLLLSLWYCSPVVLGPLSPHNFALLLLLVLIVTVLIPLISIGVLRLFRSIGSLHMASRQDRYAPFLLMTVVYSYAAWSFYTDTPYNDVVKAFFICLAINIALLTLITFFWKISVHASGMAGLVGVFLAVWFKYPAEPLMYPFMVLVITAGAVMTGRLYLHAHSPGEIAGGAALGFLTCFGGLMLLA